MKSMIESNLEILQQNPFHIIDPINENEVHYKFAGYDQSTQEEFFMDSDGRFFMIKPELDETFSPDLYKRELIFIFGVYGLDEIKYIIELANKNTTFIIIEPEKSFFYHALNRKDMSFLNKINNVSVVIKPIDDLPTIVDKLFQTQLIYRAKNIRFYSTYFYRHYHSSILSRMITIISSGLTYKLFVLGNSIEDSIKGLRQNLHNIRYLPRSKDFAKLKGLFSGNPAFVVSAGPSLDKNIHWLKKAKDKGVIIAVDTIFQKLLSNGIVPDFLTSIERTEEVYRYFYQDKLIPSSVTLVGPLVLRPEIFREYPGRYIIPMRDMVGEYMWLADKLLNLTNEYFMQLGVSCAHVAFSLAHHIGSNPIILVGQDLAYGEDLSHTHSSGTIYDNDDLDNLNNSPIEVDGYYGGKVSSRKVWVDFKKWFELEITSHNLKVINATEGGAKIDHTEQIPLNEAVERYCSNNDVNLDVVRVLDKQPNYPFDKMVFINNLQAEIQHLHEIEDFTKSAEKRLQEIVLDPSANKTALLDVLNNLKTNDELISRLWDNKLVFHNLQAFIVQTMQTLNSIPQVLTFESIKANYDLQCNFCYTTHKVLDMIIQILEKNYEEYKTVLE